MGKKTKAHWDKFCAEWNEKHPVGTEVDLKRDNGETLRTRTRSVAYTSDAGYPVVFLDGVTGYYLMDRVSAVNGRANAK